MVSYSQNLKHGEGSLDICNTFRLHCPDSTRSFIKYTTQRLHYWENSNSLVKSLGRRMADKDIEMIEARLLIGIPGDISLSDSIQHIKRMDLYITPYCLVGIFYVLCFFSIVSFTLTSQLTYVLFIAKM